MLERVGLGDFARRYPNELSGGQQQRVALARALIADTGLILCDEPLSNLDADLRERMRVEISSLVREAGATTVYITHDQAEAFALADHIGVLEEGVLVQSGTPEDVYNHPATPFVARFTGLAGELRVRVAAHGGDGTLEIIAADGAAGRLPVMRPAGAALPRPGPGCGPRGRARTAGPRCGPATRRCWRSGRPASSWRTPRRTSGISPGGWPTWRSAAGATSTPSTCPASAG